MADRRSQVLNFIYWWAKRQPRRGRLFIGPKGRVNQRAIAGKMGVDPGTFTRVVKGENRPGEDFMLGLHRMTGYQFRSDLESQIEDAEPAPRGAYGSNYP